MCGIAGVFRINKQLENEQVIRKMTNCMDHRGPDADGFFADASVALGHRRLSIIDLSEKSNQPLFDVSGNYSIIFNGEIYNYQQIKSRLTDYPFQTNGDGEVVLAAYIRWGAESLQQLKGMFAFAIWNKSSEELFVVRDRLGVKPLYYYYNDGSFLFASEIRSLLGSELVPRKINRNALVDYLAFQSFQFPETVVENVFELEAGSFAIISKGKFEKKVFWDMNQFTALDPGTTAESVHEKVHALLLQSVQRRMVSDVPVAAFLSGGSDSTAIVGLMAAVADAPQTFNIAFNDKEFDESEYASIVAKKFNTRHHKVLIKPEAFLAELPNALNAMDSPSGDGINTYVVSKAIREKGIKVALSGVGGDELFAGYPIFHHWKKLNSNKWIWAIPRPLRKLLATTLGNSDNKKQRMGQILAADKCDISHIYPILRQVNADSTIRGLLSSAPWPLQLQKTLSTKQQFLGKYPLYSQITIAEYLGYTRQTLLKDTDQMSMANSLEVREPFFDHELIEYILRVDDKFKTGTDPKSLLLEAVKGLVPPEIYQRPKKGFVFPWNNWLRNELRSYCEGRINSLAKRDFIQKDFLMKYWEDFLERRNSVGYASILILVGLENYISKHELQ